MPFFVELPVDKYGNRAYTNSFPCVIEAYQKDTPYGEQLEIVAPVEIASKLNSILRDSYCGWLEVEGPARPLTWEERESLIYSKLA